MDILFRILSLPLNYIKDFLIMVIENRAFHNVLRDYKQLLQENQRTYLNGIVHSHRKTEKVFFFLTTRDVRCVHHG